MVARLPRPPPPHTQHPRLAACLHFVPPCSRPATCRARARRPPAPPPAARRRAPPRLCSSPPPLNEEDLVPLSLPASQLPEFAVPQFSLEPIEPAARPTSPSALLAVPAVGPETW